MMNFPRVMIAAPSSGSGKSMIATGLMAAFSKRFPVQGFKVGPDYIDPMYHTAATGRPSRNLDSWMLTPKTIRQIFVRASQGASLSVIEGVMGLFDGHGSDPYVGSSAALAGLLESPVILVLDCSKMSGSAAAVVHGMNTFSSSLRLAGIICNRVGGNGHGRWLKEAIEKYTSIPVLGTIPQLPSLIIPERHLGLFTVSESPSAAKEFIRQATKVLSQYLDLERILAIAEAAPLLSAPDQPEDETTVPEPVIRLAVARDEAFCFYYEDNLEALQRCGAQIVPFSPLKDKRLPAEISGIYFGGGYPELYAEQLGRNSALCQQVRDYCQQQMPIYAECGGLMYLTEGIRYEENRYQLVGILPGWCEISKRLYMSYREFETLQPTLLAGMGTKLRGHEFHYSRYCQPVELQHAAYRVLQGSGDYPLMVEGYAKQNLLASYIHVHFAQDSQLARNFVERCRAWKVRKAPENQEP
jgi:cobyrinic acid a,c-diamide synthase